MPASHLDLSVPLQVEFAQIDDARVRGSGVLLSDPNGRYQLDTDVPRADLRTCLKTLAGNLDPEAMRMTGISVTEWESHAIWARNDISHEGAPNDEAGDQYVTPSESRAVRDATHIIVGLSLVSMMGLNAVATRLAAQRLETKYGIRHGITSIFDAPS